MKETVRGTVLATAKALTEGDRNEAYGSPYLNLSQIAALWSAYICEKYAGQIVDPLSLILTAEDAAHMNTLQKMARTFRRGYREDNYVDSAAYQAIAAECRLEEEGG